MKTDILFSDRREAGHLLGTRLAAEFALDSGTLTLGLVRGGAVIACYLAGAAGLAWDILLVRKLGAPHQPEYAIGAFAEPGLVQVNAAVMAEMGLDAVWLAATRARAEQECAHLHRELRGDRPAPALRSRDLVLCDDGMATGLTMQAAIAAVRGAGAGRIIVAVPVLPSDAVSMLERLKVELCYLACPSSFTAVGQFYSDFSAVASQEVRQLLGNRP